MSKNRQRIPRRSVKKKKPIEKKNSNTFDFSLTRGNRMKEEKKAKIKKSKAEIKSN